MSAAGLRCANQGCPSAGVFARFTVRPLLAVVYPFARGSDAALPGDFVPDARGRCRLFSRRQPSAPAPAVRRAGPSTDVQPRSARPGRQGRLL